MGGTETDFSMSPIMRNVPKKKNSVNFTGQNIIHLQALGNEEKEVIYSGFKKSIQNDNKNENKNDNKLDINEERINELTSRKKRENVIREDSPLKPAFKQAKRKITRKKEKDSDNENDNIEFVDNNDDEEDDKNEKDSSNDSFEHDEDSEKAKLEYISRIINSSFICS